MGAFDLVELSHSNPTWKKARDGLGEFDSSNIKLNIKEYYKNVKEKNRK